MVDYNAEKELIGMTDRIFSVMKKRDDLPEMNLPLAVLFMLGSAVFAAAAAKIASPADSTSVFSSTSIVGIAASLPFLPLAGCLYSLLILLWRRMLSLLATPVMFLAMLAFGADIFPSAVISVSLLFVSYVYAVSLIGRENRFRRIACLAMSAALCIVLTLIAKLGIVFDSFSGFTRAFMSEIPALMSQAASSYIGAASGENITLDPELFASAARDILIMIPAYIGVLSIVIAWFMDFLASSAFRVLDCEDVFIEITPSVSLPFSYAAVYAAVFVMFVLTASDSSPMLTMMFRSVL